MLRVTPTVSIPESEVEWSAIRASGAGGQHVNKASTAVHLRFDIKASSLPEEFKQGLMQMRDQRISKEGILIIKAQNYRSQEMNREDALQRLIELLQVAGRRAKVRKQTRPSRGSQLRRLGKKSQRSQVKAMRGRVSSGDE